MTTEYSTGYEPRVSSVTQQLTHPMVRNRVRKKVVEVPTLREDGENWAEYREKLFEAAEQQNLLGLLDGTNTKPNEPWNPRRIATWLRDNTEVQYLLATTTPSLIWDHFTISTAHAMFTHLKNLFEKVTTTTHILQSLCTDSLAQPA